MISSDSKKPWNYYGTFTESSDIFEVSKNAIRIFPKISKLSKTEFNSTFQEQKISYTILKLKIPC